MVAEFRAAFPDLNFWGVGDLIAEGDYVVGRWDGGGTNTGPAFKALPVGSLPAKSGRKMKFTGTTVLKLRDRKIGEEIGEEGALTAPEGSRSGTSRTWTVQAPSCAARSRSKSAVSPAMQRP